MGGRRSSGFLRGGVKGVEGPGGAATEGGVAPRVRRPGWPWGGNRSAVGAGTGVGVASLRLGRLPVAYAHGARPGFGGA